MASKGHRWGLVLLFALSSAGVFTGLHACRTATQVKVDIRTSGIDCTQELKNIAITVAKDAETAESLLAGGNLTSEVTSCESASRVGTLVITPDIGTGAIVIAASYTGARCIPPAYDGCIVARRRFTFVDNVALELPITLDAACRDVPCGVFSSCKSGTCVDSTTDCRADGTCSSLAEPGPVPTSPVDDAGGPIRDAAIDVRDASTILPLGGGNGCPAASGVPSGSSAPFVYDAGPDCIDEGGGPAAVCCGYQGFYCAMGNHSSQSCMGAPVFQCTGRKHCSGYCCGTQDMQGSACGPTIGCDEDAGLVEMCNSNDDCPPAKQCTGVYTNRGNGYLKHCQ